MISKSYAPSEGITRECSTDISKPWIDLGNVFIVNTIKACLFVDQSDNGPGKMTIIPAYIMVLLFRHIYIYIKYKFKIHIRVQVYNFNRLYRTVRKSPREARITWGKKPKSGSVCFPNKL